jgi:hypothetical protein
LRYFILKTIVSPRQARDKHRESTQKERGVFRTSLGQPAPFLASHQGDPTTWWCINRWCINRWCINRWCCRYVCLLSRACLGKNHRLHTTSGAKRSTSFHCEGRPVFLPLHDAAKLLVGHLQEENAAIGFECRFPCVCPEPVLVN